MNNPFNNLEWVERRYKAVDKHFTQEMVRLRGKVAARNIEQKLHHYIKNYSIVLSLDYLIKGLEVSFRNGVIREDGRAIMSLRKNDGELIASLQTSGELYLSVSFYDTSTESWPYPTPVLDFMASLVLSKGGIEIIGYPLSENGVLIKDYRELVKGLYRKGFKDFDLIARLQPIDMAEVFG